ncbi:aminoglycoside phosphotransferase family protein [Fischerella sp. JS2]|uniref:aminoglycoside phosphotransferase family protein n=1 Tax=Fischerella sp. JS2 TaxID=2597771 RepID=UPI0028E6FD83|nr:aminoglycoside phosphotransferase family protein [Fischerella sp. JS2]
MWSYKASTWIHQQLDALSLSATAPIEQVKSQTRSCLLRVRTTVGTLYLKTGYGIFGTEATFTDFLAQLYPNCLPKLIAVDTEQQWMLMREFEGQHLGKTADISRWEAALRRYAEIQVQMAIMVNQLLDIGFPDRRINQLTQRIEPLFADDAALLLPQNNPFLQQSDLEELRTLIPQLLSWCEVLETCGIPQTLIHGDFYCQNVIDAQESYIYFDWSDSAVSHPFFDAGFFLFDIAQELPNVVDVQTHLRNAYLEPWTVYLPMKQLTSVFQITQPLAALYHAIVSYEIIQHLEPAHRWETENTVPYYLKTMLGQISS